MREYQIPSRLATQNPKRDSDKALKRRFLQTVIQSAARRPTRRRPDREQDRERGCRDRVQLLAGVEPPLRPALTAQPGTVVFVEEVDLVQRRPQASPVAQRDHRGKRNDPGLVGGQAGVCPARRPFFIGFIESFGTPQASTPRMTREFV